MSPRERVLLALSRKQPDRAPFDLKFVGAAVDTFRAKTGSDNSDDYFDVDPRQIWIGPTKLKTDFTPWIGELPPGGYVSEWGEGNIPGSAYHFTDYIHPLANAKTPKEIHDYPWPDLLADYRWEGFTDTVRYWHDKGYAVTSGMDCLFEYAFHLRGLENMLCDMVQQPEIATAIFDEIENIRVEFNRRVAEAGVDVLLLADDVGTQRGMMISLELFRKWLAPRHAKVIAEAKRIKPDMHIFFHSDGDVRTLLPDLIEIGVTVLEPVQPECMDPAWVKAEFGDKLAFWGTMGTQTTMPFGTPDEVHRVVKERVETVGKGGGLLLAPTHVLEPDVPWENIVAFVEAVHEYGRYE